MMNTLKPIIFDALENEIDNILDGFTSEPEIESIIKKHHSDIPEQHGWEIIIDLFWSPIYDDGVWCTIHHGVWWMLQDELSRSAKHA